MSYLYETHMHTNVGSKCGTSAPEEYIEAYLERGYSGIIITDHFFNGNCAIDPTLPWKVRVDQYAAAYERAKKVGDRLGLDVFFGLETRLGNDECLVYGVDKEWLYGHPELETVNHQEQYELIHSAGGAVVQAHPYRERGYMDAVDIYPTCVDAFEGYNKENSREEDRKAIKLARELGLPITAGSDIHNVSWMKETSPFGVIVEKKWTSIMDYVELLRRKDPSAFSLSIPDEEKRKEDVALGFQVNIHR